MSEDRKSQSPSLLNCYFQLKLGQPPHPHVPILPQLDENLTLYLHSKTYTNKLSLQNLCSHFQVQLFQNDVLSVIVNPKHNHQIYLTHCLLVCSSHNCCNLWHTITILCRQIHLSYSWELKNIWIQHGPLTNSNWLVCHINDSW